MVFQKEFQSRDLPERAHTSCAYYRTDENGNFPMHCHSYYELSYVESGERFEICHGKRYLVGAGSLFFIPPLVFHANRNVSPVDVAVIQFSPNFPCGSSSMPGGFSLSRPEGAPPAIPLSENALAVLRRIVGFCLSEHENFIAMELMRCGLIIELISVLLTEGELILDAGSNGFTGMPELDAVISHILSHPDTRTDMKQAARIANMSYYAFSRMFKEVIGVNFSDYCNIIRVGLAEEMLINTMLPVSEIAEKTGIGTQSYFSRLFRQQSGMSPTEYRARFGPAGVKGFQ